MVTVTPAANPRHEKRQSLDADRLSLLKSIGVASVTDAHAILSKRRELEAIRKGVLAELKALKVADDPAPVIAKLKSNLAETDVAISAAMAATGRKSLPSQNEIEEEKIEVSQKRTFLDARRLNLEEARKGQQEALENAVELRSGAESKLELIRKGIAQDVALCLDAERSARDATLVSSVTAAETAHQTATTTLAAMQQAMPDAAEIERREARCQRLEQALENQNNELMQLQRDIGQLTGQIQTAGGDGVGEALAAAQEQRALAERELTRIQERVATLQLLRDTVSGCLAEGRERYYEPVRRHLCPFLNDSASRCRAGTRRRLYNFWHQAPSI